MVERSKSTHIHKEIVYKRYKNKSKNAVQKIRLTTDARASFFKQNDRTH